MRQGRVVWEVVSLKLLEEEGLKDRFEIDSAGTGGWHTGERADSRTRAAASKRGIEILSRSRQFKAPDFARFDYILAMDQSNRENLRAQLFGWIRAIKFLVYHLCLLRLRGAVLKNTRL